MKGLYAYIRVSTQKQGERGSSLQEQRAAIEAYASRHGLKVITWFEETETAAKSGRRVFNQMLRQLARGMADGVVIHKIDRSARNLRDWADLGEMIDQGIQVHFANESLDLNTRGGRLSADIQAVVAADYIRNLREEVRKGLYGRLKQGFYPLPAPIGYRDGGAAIAKSLDPVTAPLIRKAFELYATGRYNLTSLGEELYRLGLRSKCGKRLAKSRLAEMLRNPFYMGLIRIKRNGQTFVGRHEPLVSKHLFDIVQSLLSGKVRAKEYAHDFAYRRKLRCASCGQSLIGECQKGHIYYRCHTRSCPRTSLRQEEADRQLAEAFNKLRLSDEDLKLLSSDFESRLANTGADDREVTASLEMQLGQLTARLDRLTDAFIDRLVERDDYESRKRRLLEDQIGIEERLHQLKANTTTLADRASTFLELVLGLNRGPDGLPVEELRLLVLKLTSNLSVTGKYVDIAWRPLFAALACRDVVACGGPQRVRPRTDLLVSEPIDSSVQASPSAWIEAVWRELLQAHASGDGPPMCPPGTPACLPIGASAR